MTAALMMTALFARITVNDYNNFREMILQLTLERRSAAERKVGERRKTAALRTGNEICAAE